MPQLRIQDRSNIQPDLVVTKTVNQGTCPKLRLEVFDSIAWRLIAVFPVDDQLAVMQAAASLLRVLGTHCAGIRVVDGRATLLECRAPNFRWGESKAPSSSRR